METENEYMPKEPMNKHYTQMDEDDISPDNEKLEQTLHIPKGRDYQIPDKGEAIIEFEKMGEDETGCTLRVLNFEPEEEEQSEADKSNNPEMNEEEGTMDHVDKFLTAKRAMGQGGY